MTTSPATDREPVAQLGLVGQLSRFVAVGVLSAMVDYGIYQALLHLGVYVHVAKGFSFICGTTTAYLLNKRFTFNGSTGGGSRFAGFVILYATTFCVNVGMNALALHLMPEGAPYRVTIGWVIAQGTATAINFLVLRTIVFRHRPAAADQLASE